MALTQIPIPFGLTWRDWADTVVGFNDALRPNMTGDLDWHEFALRLAEYESQAPRSEPFTSWEDWACALKQAYPN